MLYRIVRRMAAPVAALFITACMGNVEIGPSSAPEAVRESVPRDLAQSDDVSDWAHGVRDGLIQLPRSMVGSKLLQTTEIAITGAQPDIRFSQPRIVYFALHHDQLALYEVNAVSPHRDLRIDHLIDTFKVIRCSPHTVVFAAPQRLRGIAAPLPVGLHAEVASALHGAVLDAEHSVLEEATLQAQTLSMRHAVTVRQNAFFALLKRKLHGAALLALKMGSVDMLVQETHYVRTTFAPYEPSPTFAPLEVLGDEKRYLTTSSVTPNSGALTSRAMHWDTHPSQAPITFGLARQMSPAIAQAVEEGLTYWNRVAGRQILEVVRDVDLATWGGARQVPVHWITWDTAPSSHAEPQANPLTGEIIAARMFLTSSFLMTGQRQCTSESLLAAQEEMQVAAELATGPFLNDELGDRARRDTLRGLAAHEGGHVLGLRHNFAGMLESELPGSEQMQQAVRDYVRGGTPSQKVSSTVMTYAGPRADLLLGAYIEQNILPYDEAAFKMLYPASAAEVTLPTEAFCSDHEVGLVYGCARFLDDVDVLRDSVDKARKARLHVAIHLLEGIYQAVQRNAGQCGAGVDNLVSPDALAVAVAQHASTAFTAYQAHDTVLTRQQYGTLRHLDPASYEILARDHIAAASRGVGGIPGWIGRVLDASPGELPTPGWLQRDVAFHVDHGSIPELAAATKSTQMWVQDTAIAWSERVEQLVLKHIIEGLTAQTSEAAPWLFGTQHQVSYPHALVDPTWEAPLTKLATDLIFMTDAVGMPRYHEDLRLAAVHLLSPRVFGSAHYGREARASLFDALISRIVETDSGMSPPQLSQRQNSDRRLAAAVYGLDV